MPNKLLINALAIVAFTSNAFGAQSLVETYELALQNDPTLAISRLTAISAQEDVQTGLASVLPTVSGAATYSVSSDRDKDSISPDFDLQKVGASITLNQNIFVLAAFTAYEAVKLNASVKDIQAAYAEQELMVRVAESYISALRAKNALSVYQAQLEAVSRQTEQTQQRYDVGLVAITDVLDASATLDQTRVGLIRAEAQYDIALQNIATITGTLPDGVWDINKNLPITELPIEGQQEWIDFALEKHPEIIAAERGLDVGRLTLTAEKENLLPRLTGAIRLNYDDYIVDANDAFPDNTNWSADFTLTLSMDLYSGGKNQARIAKQGITNNIAEQQTVMLKRGKAAEVSNYYRMVQADSKNIAAQTQALKSRESALQATQVGYEVGTRNIVEVLNAQLAVFNAQTTLNNARYDYLLNLLRLKKASGQLAFGDLESIEQYLIP